MFQWVTQRDARFFPDPETFQPERWTDEFASSLPKYAYFPFGGGPRFCIGNSFAMMEIVLVLASIGQQFRLALAPDHPVSILPAMSLRPKDGIRVVIESRYAKHKASQ
jgi:cytochrome P450